MAVVDLDPALTAAGPAAVDAALADVAGEPALVRFHAEGLRAAADERGLRSWLRTVPAATLGIGEPPRAYREALDIWVDDQGTADRLAHGFARAPLAGMTLALLARNGAGGWPGLVAESTAYSMLQAGPEFVSWRASHVAEPSGDDAPRVRVEVENGRSVVTLLRADRHNALDVRLRDELDGALASAAANAGPVIVHGEGPSFCSGGDVDEFGELPDPATAHVIRLSRSLAWRFHQLGRRLVVGLHGACLGAGIELPAFAAHVVASDDARIGLPELGMGLIPGAGGTVSIPRRAGRHTLLRLAWDGEPIDAYRARRWGLVDEVVPPSRLVDRVFEVASTL